MKDDWSFTIENCDVNDDALNELAGLKNNKFDAKSVTFRKINDATTAATKATSPSEVTVKVNCDTTDAITQLQDLYTMLDQLNEQVMRVKENIGTMEGTDIFTNNYNNCTFLYGKYGRANVYNDCSEIDENEDVNFEDNECNYDCEDCNYSNK